MNSPETQWPTIIQSSSPYIRRLDAEHRINDVLKALDLIAPLEDLPIVHRKKFIKELIWKYTEAEGGKYNLRYSTIGALLSEDKKGLQHEHVYQNEWLAQKIIDKPEDARLTIQVACACLITKREHAELNKSKHLIGWERYQHAHIPVYQITGTAWERIV